MAVHKAQTVQFVKGDLKSPSTIKILLPKDNSHSCNIVLGYLIKNIKQ